MERRVFYRVEGNPLKCVAVEFVSTDEYADGRRWLDPRTGNVIPSGNCLGYCDTAEAAWDVAVNVAEQHEREMYKDWDDACRLLRQVRTTRLMALSDPQAASTPAAVGSVMRAWMASRQSCRARSTPWPSRSASLAVLSPTAPCLART